MRGRLQAGVVIVAGTLLVAFAVFYDALGGGSQFVFGFKQALLAAVGLAVLGAGAFLLSGKGQGFLARVDRAAAPAAPPGVVLLAVVFFGILGGLGELAILLIQEPPHHFIDQRLLTPHAGWKLPLAYVLLLAVPGVAVAVAASVWMPFLRSLRTAVSVLTFLVVYGWLQLYLKELGRTPILLLSVGLAAVVGRLSGSHPAGMRRLLLRGTPLLVVGTLIVGLAVPVGVWWRERQAIGRQPAEEGRPNVVLVILDQVRARSMSLYGYARGTTPFLERLADEATVFDLAISTASWTLPSHAAMFTGHYPLEMSTDWTMPLDETLPTLAEALAGHGYLTAGFVANTAYAGHHTGLARGFLRYDVDADTPTGLLTASGLGRDLLERRRVRRLLRLREEPGLKRAPMVSAEFLRWVDRVGDGPFFAFLNYMDAHTSYLPWPAVEGRFASDSAQLMPPPVMARAQEKRPSIRRLMNQYDERIRLLDDEMERLVAELERRGLLDNTLLIIASDHGEEFGERGVMFHGRSLYMQSLHVPLLVRFPGRVPEGLRVTEPVGLVELPATVTDLLRPPKSGRFPGESLARYWTAPGVAVVDDGNVRAETNGKPWMPEDSPVSRGDMRSFVTPDYHYILNGDGVEELYRTTTDPWDQNDLVTAPESDSVLRPFRGLSVGLPALELGSNVQN